MFSHSCLFFQFFFPVFFSYILVTCKRWSIYIYIIYMCNINIYIYIYVCLCIYYFILIDFPSSRQAIIHTQTHTHTHTSATKNETEKGGRGLCHFGIPYRRGGKGGAGGGGDRDTHTGRNKETFPDTHKTGAAGRRRRGVPANSRGEARPPHKSGYHKGAGGKAPA